MSDREINRGRRIRVLYTQGGNDHEKSTWNIVNVRFDSVRSSVGPGEFSSGIGRFRRSADPRPDRPSTPQQSTRQPTRSGQDIHSHRRLWPKPFSRDRKGNVSAERKDTHSGDQPRTHWPKLLENNNRKKKERAVNVRSFLLPPLRKPMELPVDRSGPRRQLVYRLETD